jgi:hypothetical protein
VTLVREVYVRLQRPSAATPSAAAGAAADSSPVSELMFSVEDLSDSESSSAVSNGEQHSISSLLLRARLFSLPSQGTDSGGGSAESTVDADRVLSVSECRQLLFTVNPKAVTPDHKQQPSQPTAQPAVTRRRLRALLRTLQVLPAGRFRFAISTDCVVDVTEHCGSHFSSL